MKKKAIYLSRQILKFMCLIAFLNSHTSNCYSHSLEKMTYPFYKVNNVTCVNNMYLANGIIVEENETWDAMNYKIETPFYIRSYDDSLWQWCNPIGIKLEKNNDSKVYDAYPRNIVACYNNFVAIIEVGDNSERKQVIHFSKDGVLWYSTGIYATSLHVIHDKIIAEHNLSIAVSNNGEQWNIYSYINWDNSFPQYNNYVPIENQNIIVKSHLDSTLCDYESYNFYSKEDYPYIRYDWFNLKSYFIDSTYILTDTTTFIALSNDAKKWRYIEIPFINDSVYALKFSQEKILFLEINNGENYLNISDNYGDNWTRIKIIIDTNDYSNFDNYSIIDVFYEDSTIILKTIVTLWSSSEEIIRLQNYTSYYYSNDGNNFLPFYNNGLNIENYKKIIISKSIDKIDYYFTSIINGKLISI